MAEIANNFWKRFVITTQKNRQQLVLPSPVNDRQNIFGNRFCGFWTLQMMGSSTIWTSWGTVQLVLRGQKPAENDRYNFSHRRQLLVCSAVNQKQGRGDKGGKVDRIHATIWSSKILRYATAVPPKRWTSPFWVNANGQELWRLDRWLWIWRWFILNSCTRCALVCNRSLKTKGIFMPIVHR